MPNLLQLLTMSGQSLGAQTSAAATASQNLQNVDTPGYARQTAVLATNLPAEKVAGAYIGTGVTLATVTQARDRFIEAQLPDAQAQAAQSSAQSDALTAISAFDPSNASGVAAALGNFYSGLSALSQNPGDLGLRQAAVANTQEMTLAFNRSANELDNARTGLDQKLSDSLAQINSLAGQVATLNQQIQAAKSSGGQPNDLLDARQNAQDQLAALTGVRPLLNGNGDVSLVFSSGQMLVNGEVAGSLSASADPTNGGHLAVSLTRPDGTRIPAGTLGGTLGGILSARDGTLARAQSGLDNLAFNLAAAVNATHKTGYGADGSTGRNLLDAGASAPGAASALQVNAAVLANPRALATSSTAGGVPGDATNLFATIATEQQALASGSNPTQTLSAIVSGFGADTQSAQATSQHDKAMLSHLGQMRQSVSGVSVDEEMINLTRAQQAYNAVAKIIQTTNEMLTTLMQMK